MNQNLTWYLALFTLPLIFTLIITPFISRFALNKNIVDLPGMHKTHRRVKPLLGGIGIFFSFSVILFIFLPVDDRILSLALATVVLVITGLCDDLYNLKPVAKLLGQAMAASIVVIWNANLFKFMVEYFTRFQIPSFVVLVLIIGWIVLMVNAFNLIDGLDGLAAGTAIIVFLAMAVLSIIEGGRPTILGVQLIGAGACLGFLYFNFSPAKIFMGDTGSMLLGFILATSHLYAIKYPFSAQLVLGSMFIFAYPALDISFAIYRRLRKRSSIFMADKGHIHHILLALGFSVRKTVLVIYLVNALFSMIAVMLLSLELSSLTMLIIGLITVTGTLLIFKRLNILSEHNNIE